MQLGRNPHRVRSLATVTVEGRVRVRKRGVRSHKVPRQGAPWIVGQTSALLHRDGVDLLDFPRVAVLAGTGVHVQVADDIDLAALGELTGGDPALQLLGPGAKGQHGVPGGVPVLAVHGKREPTDERAGRGGAKLRVPPQPAGERDAFLLGLCRCLLVARRSLCAGR